MSNEARLIQGNRACAEAALMAGVTFFAGYPITPSTEIAEILAEELPKIGGKFAQMEDEIASIACVIGASLTGKKVLTASSGPGISLKQENIGYAAMAEIPCVIVNVQRMGPSTGGPTSPAQGDMMQARWGTHGDHPIIALCPTSVKDCFDLTVKAVNFAEEFRTPVYILMDEIIGHMRESVVLPEKKDVEIFERVRTTKNCDEFLPYEHNERMVPDIADFGTGYKWHVTGLIHDETGFPRNTPEVSVALLDRLMNKLEHHKERISIYETIDTADAEILVVAYGSTARAAVESVHNMRKNGIKAGLFLPKTIWPFPEEALQEAAAAAKHVLTAEMNYGQIYLETSRICREKENHLLSKVDGSLITSQEITEKAMEVLKK